MAGNQTGGKNMKLELEKEVDQKLEEINFLISNATQEQRKMYYKKTIGYTGTNCSYLTFWASTFLFTLVYEKLIDYKKRGKDAKN